MDVTYGVPAAVVAPQEVTIGAASAQSAAFNAATLLPANMPLPFKVQKGASWKVAAIQELAAGKLSITELPD
jgi:hypothetical protein